MTHRCHRMMEYHPRSRKTHDCADSLPHFCTNLRIGALVAVYPAVGAERLGFHERAFVAPLPCISIKRLTFRTKTVFPSMLLFAVKGNHLRHHRFFPFPFCLNTFYHLFFLLPKKICPSETGFPQSTQYRQSSWWTACGTQAPQFFRPALPAGILV